MTTTTERALALLHHLKTPDQRVMYVSGVF
jgi:hypothetical protein